MVHSTRWIHDGVEPDKPGHEVQGKTGVSISAFRLLPGLRAASSCSNTPVAEVFRERADSPETE